MRKGYVIILMAFLFVLILMLVLVSCAEPLEEGDTPTIREGSRLTREVDVEAGVACWWTDSSDAGIFCMPIDQTNLGWKGD